MKKSGVYIIAFILIAGIGGWVGYKYFFVKKTPELSENKISVKRFSQNSCWVYHEYVYRVDFSDQLLQPFFFIREADGTFSPSIADSAGNHLTGNGFIIDSTGACAITEKTATPWKMSNEEQKPLRALVDAWLDMKEGLTNTDYRIAGQTVALFAVLNDPKEFIEYSASSPAPGQQGYNLMYPLHKIQLSGINPGYEFSADASASGYSAIQVLKKSFEEKNSEIPGTITGIDSISVTITNDGLLENITVLKGDDFFYEGSAVFDQYGRLRGILHYENKKWELIPISSFIQNPPAYADNEIPEKWKYDSNTFSWGKISGEHIADKNLNNPETREVSYKPGPLEPTIKVYSTPTPK